MRALEQSPLYPYVAWSLVVIFAVSTLWLAIKLYQVSEQIDESSTESGWQYRTNDGGERE